MYLAKILHANDEEKMTPGYVRKNYGAESRGYQGRMHSGVVRLRVSLLYTHTSMNVHTTDTVGNKNINRIWNGLFLGMIRRNK